MKKSFFLLLALLFVAQIASATIRRVNNNSGYTAAPPVLYTTLDAAWTAAAAGDTLILEASPNYYFVGSPGIAWNINKKITLVGNGFWLDLHPGLQVNPAPSYIQNNIYFVAGGQNSVMKGIRMVDGYSGYIRTDNITLERCWFYAMYWDGGNTANTTIKSCWSTYDMNVDAAGNGNANTGILISNSVVNLGSFQSNTGDIGVIENCVFGLNSGGSGNLDLGDSNASGASFVVTNSIVRGSVTFAGNSVLNNNIFNAYNYTLNSNIYLNNSTNFNALFTNSNASTDVGLTLNAATSFSYTLDGASLTGNPAINTGIYSYSTATHTSSVGDDRGAYNDGTNRPSWKPGIVPDFPAIYLLNGGGVVTGNNVTFNVSIQSNN